MTEQYLLSKKYLGTFIHNILTDHNLFQSNYERKLLAIYGSEVLKLGQMATVVASVFKKIFEISIATLVLQMLKERNEGTMIDLYDVIELTTDELYSRMRREKEGNA